MLYGCTYVATVVAKGLGEGRTDGRYWERKGRKGAGKIRIGLGTLLNSD